MPGGARQRYNSEQGVVFVLGWWRLCCHIQAECRLPSPKESFPPDGSSAPLFSSFPILSALNVTGSQWWILFRVVRTPGILGGSPLCSCVSLKAESSKTGWPHRHSADTVCLSAPSGACCSASVSFFLKKQIFASRFELHRDMGWRTQVYDPIDTVTVNPWASLSNHKEIEPKGRGIAVSSERTQVRNFVLFQLSFAYWLYPSYLQTSPQVQVPRHENLIAIASVSYARVHLLSSKLCPTHQIESYATETVHKEGQCILGSFSNIRSMTPQVFFNSSAPCTFEDQRRKIQDGCWSGADDSCLFTVHDFCSKYRIKRQGMSALILYRKVIQVHSIIISLMLQWRHQAWAANWTNINVEMRAVIEINAFYYQSLEHLIPALRVPLAVCFWTSHAES